MIAKQRTECSTESVQLMIYSTTSGSRSHIHEFKHQTHTHDKDKKNIICSELFISHFEWFFSVRWLSCQKVRNDKTHTWAVFAGSLIVVYKRIWDQCQSFPFVKKERRQANDKILCTKSEVTAFLRYVTDSGVMRSNQLSHQNDKWFSSIS